MAAKKRKLGRGVSIIGGGMSKVRSLCREEHPRPFRRGLLRGHRLREQGY